MNKLYGDYKANRLQFKEFFMIFRQKKDHSMKRVELITIIKQHKNALTFINCCVRLDTMNHTERLTRSTTVKQKLLLHFWHTHTHRNKKNVAGKNDYLLH